MRLLVVGGISRRVLDEAKRRGLVSSVRTAEPGMSVSELVSQAREADVLVGAAADPGSSMRVPLAAVAAGRPAVVAAPAAADHRDHLDLDGDARETGITIVTGASASPAIPVVLARQAARGLDEVRSVEVSWALPPSTVADDALARLVVEGLTRPALVRGDGAYSYAAPGRAVPVAFPDPVGTARACTFGGAESWSIGDVLGGRPWVRVSLGGTVPWWWATVRRQTSVARRLGLAASAVGLAGAVSRLARFAGDPGWTGVRVEVEGMQGPASVSRVLGGFDDWRSWDGAGILLGLDTLARRPGPGVVVAGSGGTAPEALSLCHDIGVRFAVLDPAA